MRRLRSALMAAVLLTVLTSAALAQGWTTATGTRFHVSHPFGWSVQDSPDGWVMVAEPNGASLTIWPFFMPGVALEPSDTGPKLIGGLAHRLQPDIIWEAWLPAPGNAVRWAGRRAADRVLGMSIWRSVPTGSSGTFYLGIMPAARAPALYPVLAGIAQSFRITGAPAPDPQSPALSWTRWMDSREYAFTVEVPAGWAVEGGTFRPSPLDVRSAVRLRAPADKAFVYAGDETIPKFVQPTELSKSLGFAEGNPYSPDGATIYIIRSYQRAEVFARDYAWRLCGGKGELRGSRSRPDIAEATRALLIPQGSLLTQTYDVGEVRFACGGKEGHLFVTLQWSGFPAGMEGGMWHVERLMGFLAEPSHVVPAQMALARMAETAQVNPVWAKSQQKLVADASKAWMEYSRYSAKVIQETYEHRQAVQDEQTRRFGNALLGVLDTVDPHTGKQHQVRSGSDYYWITPQETIVGTDTHYNPDPNLDFRQLMVLP